MTMYMWKNCVQLSLEDKELFGGLPVGIRMLGRNIRGELKLS